jgi:DNA-binding transcriptional LysR family regulator
MDLNRTNTFVRVVESGGFTRAAHQLGLPPSSVSRSVARLEDELGITLLERTTRKVALTDAGRAYFERARDALAGLAEANALALDAAREVHGLVRVALPIELGSKFGPSVAAFGQAHPRIRVEVTLSPSGADLVGDVVDLAVALGRLPDSSLVARKLGDSIYQLYAAPSYLAARGAPKTIAELERHDGVAMRAIAGRARWELTGPRGEARVDIPVRLAADHHQLILDVTRAGLGIALLPAFIAAPDVATGALQEVLPRYSATEPLHVVHHASRYLPRRVVLFRDFVAASLSGSCKEAGALR